jgi:hypothetical protein
LLFLFAFFPLCNFLLSSLISFLTHLLFCLRIFLFAMPFHTLIFLCSALSFLQFLQLLLSLPVVLNLSFFNSIYYNMIMKIYGLHPKHG